MSLRTEATEPLGESIIAKIISLMVGLFFTADQTWE